jgi:hypothetical protein
VSDDKKDWIREQLKKMNEEEDSRFKKLFNKEELKDDNRSSGKNG